MWIAVTPRFSALHRNVLPTLPQREDAQTKVAGVTRKLNQSLWGIESDVANAQVIGSWGKETHTPWTDDVDLLFEISWPTFQRYEAYVGNGQSALLQEVRNALLERYPQTQVRGDNQVVVVAFNSVTIEVVPGYPLGDGTYWIPNTPNGGAWRRTWPHAERSSIDLSDIEHNGNARTLIRMVKAWRAVSGAPIKAFQIEILVQEFLRTSPWRYYGYFYYDWLVRDFFAYLVSRADGLVFLPGSYDPSWIGSNWLSRARTAEAAAAAACEHERYDRVTEAGDQWRRIFGELIPRTTT